MRIAKIHTPGPLPSRRSSAIRCTAVSLLASAALAVCLTGNANPVAPAATSGSDHYRQLAEDILREQVEFETTADKPGQIQRALEALAQRLEAAGFPADDVRMVNPYPSSWGLVARYRGTGSAEPLLTMAHVDVVFADPDAWSFPPFEFGKKDGFYFGRGTQDNKAGIAQMVANFIRLKDEGFVPKRDLILLVTGDEETQQKVAEWLASEGRELIEAEFAINSDVTAGELGPAGEHGAFWVQTSEKRYHSFRLHTSNRGGHSSLPRKDNAIYELASALTRIAAHEFPVELNDSNRMMLERASRLENGQTAADMRAVAEHRDEAAAQRLSRSPYYNAILRTTCVATMLEAGHAENALPRQASATVNCRIMPGRSPEEVQHRLESVVDNPDIRFETVYRSVASPESVLPAAILETLEALVDETWPGATIIPEMSTGTTDGLFLRNAGIPVYGVAGWFQPPDEMRAHGLDEKIGIHEFHESVEFWYRMLRAFSR